MKTTTTLTRQAMACGFEKPAPARIAVRPWEPPRSEHGFEGDAPTTCAGYTSNLPEVRGVDHARRHWKVGAIAAWCGDEQPHEQMLMALEILDGQCNAVESYRMIPAKDGGGGR